MESTPVGEPHTPSAFEKFRDLTRKLIRVPKEELDARLAEEKARKAVPVVDKNTAPQGG